MKFYLLSFFQLLFFPFLQAEITCWNHPSQVSYDQVSAFAERIFSDNPDLVCVRVENAFLLEEMLSSSYPHIFHDQGVLVASKTPIKDLQFTPFNCQDTTEGILQIALFDKYIYVPFFSGAYNELLLQLTWRKIVEDFHENDQISLFATGNGLRELRHIEFFQNMPSENLLCDGPSLNLDVRVNNEGEVKAGAGVTWETTFDNGNQMDLNLGGGVKRDSEGNISGEASVELKINLN